MFRSIVTKIFDFFFPFRRIIKNQKEQIEILQKKLEYLQRHSDITKLLPATGKIRELQLKNLEYVHNMNEFFESELGVKPFMEGGALLGKIRHNGYVPWDDDLDFGLLREDFNKVINYCKKHFFWADVHYIKENSYLEFDKIIRAHQGENVAIQTPYCLHIYKGTDMNNVLNAEYFPWDYVRTDISQDDYVLFAKEYKKKLNGLHSWIKIFEYIENDSIYKKIYTLEKTNFIAPGFGHWDLAKQTIRGYYNHNDIFPLKKEQFENVNVYIPNNSDKYLKFAYGKYMEYPNDFGISHNLEEIANSLN